MVTHAVTPRKHNPAAASILAPPRHTHTKPWHSVHPSHSEDPAPAHFQALCWAPLCRNKRGPLVQTGVQHTQYMSVNTHAQWAHSLSETPRYHSHPGPNREGHIGDPTHITVPHKPPRLTVESVTHSQACNTLKSHKKERVTAHNGGHRTHHSVTPPITRHSATATHKQSLIHTDSHRGETRCHPQPHGHIHGP